MPSTPVPSSSGLRLSRHSSKSLTKICAICLNTMKSGHGAIFTAECSHAFHFHCIASNVKHGNQVCPICRAKWKEIPLQSPSNEIIRGRRSGIGAWPQDDQWVTLLRRLPSPIVDTPSPRHASSPFHVPERIFDDDEFVISQPETNENSPASLDSNFAGTLDVKAYPEVSAVSRSACHQSFTILVHLKAPSTARQPESLRTGSRVPVDLVTVLDVSGSMAGTKLALLKRAMGFVIQNLGSYDRLSVIAFSSTARRLFPLRIMTDIGKQEALQAVNSLASGGGTNIAEALKKGARVMTERKSKNPVSGIILLSDGQDTYTLSPRGTHREPLSLLPVTMHRDSSASISVPVHTFGFGIDHDAVAMHSISEKSGGTFSFIEAENVIQDAFAQCIGGLLSVMVQELVVQVECRHPSLQLSSIKAGSYKTSIHSDNRMGSVEIGDLYAEEERDFLVSVDIPVQENDDKMSVLRVKCTYKDPVSKESVTLNGAGKVKIQRPETTGELAISVDVDRQRNRLRSAECMAEARAAAERGDLAGAVSVLENCRQLLVESASYKDGDRLCAALEAELRKMQERMANQQVYETSGRAYVLSGMSSHSWQRATARGDSTDRMSTVQAYQTPSMVDMVSRSQTLVLGSGAPSPRSSLRPAVSFPARPSPR